MSIQLSDPACRKLRERVWQELESAIYRRSTDEGKRGMCLCMDTLDCLRQAEQAFDERNPSGTAAVEFPEHVVEWLAALRSRVNDRLDELEGGAEDEAALLTCESEAFVLRVLDRIARSARLGKTGRA